LRKRGFDHHAIAECGDPEVAEQFMPMIHLVFSNLKTWLNGSSRSASTALFRLAFAAPPPIAYKRYAVSRSPKASGCIGDRQSVIGRLRRFPITVHR